MERGSASDVSAHRILSDISAFIGHEDPSRHRILAAGDLNMIYGATGNTLALPAREKAFWDRVAALGLEFLGPQAPDGWQPAGPQPDVPADTKNVPTWVRNGRPPEEANRQFDYAIASRGFHERVKVARPQPPGRMGPERPLPAADRGRYKIGVSAGRSSGAARLRGLEDELGCGGAGRKAPTACRGGCLEEFGGRW